MIISSLSILHAVAEMIKYCSQIEIVFSVALSATSRNPVNQMISMLVMSSIVKFYYDSEAKI